MTRATVASSTSAPLQVDGGGSKRTAVLLYHRVAELPTDPLLLAVSVRRFREQLAMLGRHFRPLRLGDVVERKNAGVNSLPGVVLTFDDGYADNLYNAKPLLEAAGIPATVFITTDYLKQSREFWWDELERLLIHPAPLPSRLVLRIQGTTQQWQLDEASSFDETDFQRLRTWNVLDGNSPTLRHRVYRDLFDALRPLADEKRATILRELRDWSARPDEIRSTHRPLSPEELAQLAEGDGVEIGGHTMTHPILAKLSPSAQHTEIAGCKHALEGILQCPVNAFSYPFGTRSDYASSTVDIVREAGFRCACSNSAATADEQTDCFQIPRILVRDWDADTLLRRIHDVLCVT